MDSHIQENLFEMLRVSGLSSYQVHTFKKQTNFKSKENKMQTRGFNGVFSVT